MKKLLSGNEAVALGAKIAGVKYASAYPGTPSTEILENLAKMAGVRADWAPNEKVALDSVAGASYAGARALASMKHVGLNVASETLFYLAYTGVNAGLVLISADDPGAWSSQNEQDNRHYARFAKVPCLEPADSQEAMDFIAIAFDLSEQFDTPVMVRTTTRISHSKSVVNVPEGNGHAPRAIKEFVPDMTKYAMIPANARRRHPVVEERLKKLADWGNTASVNRIEWGDKSIGIVSSSVAYQYATEVFGGYSFLKLGMSYPLPEKLIRDFAAKVEKLVVVEELDPFFEHEIRAMGIPCVGKEYFPMTNEFSLAVVREGARKLGVAQPVFAAASVPEAAQVPTRPPALCPGCPHRSTFYTLRKLKLRVAGDIGCYSIGVLPPFNAIDTLGCMGASLGVAQGVDAVGENNAKHPWVAVIGDSTFFHAGMPALANIIYNRGASTVLILDNDTTAMTGQQENPGTGKTLQGASTQKIDIEQVVRGMGVKDVFVVDAFDEPEVEKTIKAAVAIKDRPSVVISRGPCVFLDTYADKYIDDVDAVKCNGCSLCFRVGCPAIFKGEIDLTTNKPKALIDPLLCIGCDVCLQVCPRDAIFRVNN
ncbi:MAG: indolepyruvate ferredoxin oxidoreductase subunit alpha [Chloroflexota bacterium]|nr:indolepyruvate ferredoxin oxidoreductase subunit alpha [Chloroflexota bacterium]